MSRKALLFVWLLGLTGIVQAQRYEVGLSLGAAMYFGDLVPSDLIDYPRTLRPTVGLLARLNVGQHLTLRGNYQFMTLFADDVLKDQGLRRGLMFRSRVHELSVSGEINLFRLNFGAQQYLSPYVLGGVGLFHFRPRAVYDPVANSGTPQPSRPELLGQWIELQPLGTEGQGLPNYEEPYALTRPNVLLGAGLKYRVAYQWMVGLEVIGRVTFFDHLDDVSNANLVYGDIITGNGVLAAEMSVPRQNPSDADLNRRYRRGGDADDYYMTFTMTLTHLFGGEAGTSGGGRIRCPTF